MKKILKPIISKFGILVTGVSLFVLASCAHKQTAMSTSNQGDIVWNSPSSKVETTVENSDVASKSASELTKADFKEIIKSQLAEGKSTPKLSLKEKIAANIIANKVNKAYQKLTPTKKAELKAEMEKQKGNSGVKQAVLVVLVGIGVCIIAALIGSVVGILGTLVWVIGALVILYGIWLALEALVF